MKSFNRANGWMLLLVFGSSALIAPLPGFYRKWQYSLPERPAFARLLRSEEKSFFGYHRYYLTCLLQEEDKEIRFTTAVNSDLFHLKRVGDNIEVLVSPLYGVRIRGNKAEYPDSAAFQLSAALALCGLLLLLVSFRKKNG